MSGLASRNVSASFEENPAVIVMTCWMVTPATSSLIRSR